MLVLSLCFLSLLTPGAHAAHGFDNNWTVAVTGMKDANDCVRVTSIMDLGANIAPTDSMTCLSATQMCSDDYSCVAAKATKPSTFAGCTFDSSTATETTVTGVLMDGLCYDNFVVEQKNFNGAPGLAPDKVHVRSMAHMHTRACLVVDYCARTGFYLLQRASDGGDYSFLGRLESDSGGAEKAFDWLVEARHPCGTTTTTTAEALTTSAAGTFPLDAAAVGAAALFSLLQ